MQEANDFEAGTDASRFQNSSMPSMGLGDHACRKATINCHAAAQQQEQLCYRFGSRAVNRAAALRSHLQTRLMLSHCSSVVPLSWKACRRMFAVTGSGRQLQSALTGRRAPISEFAAATRGEGWGSDAGSPGKGAERAVEQARRMLTFRRSGSGD